MTLREQIDTHLKRMAQINCKLGLDSTKEENRIAKAEIKECLQEIKKLDKSFYDAIEPPKTDNTCHCGKCIEKRMEI